MSSRRNKIPAITLLTLAFGLWSAGCTSDEAPTGVSGGGSAPAAAGAPQRFGPFPGGTTIFVDVDNMTGVENGTRAHPFNTIREALAAAKNSSVVGVAAGLYAETFGPSLTPNYVIDGLRNFKLLGSGAGQTTIRGDHSFSLIRVQNGASAQIKDLTIEHGGRLPNSEGGGIQVIGRPGAVSLTLTNVVLQDNEAVNGGAIAADGQVTLALVNVLIANNHAENCCGGVVLEGVTGKVTGRFKNTTITDNTANFLVGGVLAENSATLAMVNSIVWNNSLVEVGSLNAGARLHISFSDVGERLFPGGHNISSDPLFADPGARDYALRRNSPAVDAGTNTAAPVTDLKGRPRSRDGDGDGVAVTDMGALERIAAP